MRTRFRRPDVSHATLLNHYDWASSRNHGRAMRKVREENDTLKLALKIKQAIGILLFAPLLAFGQGITTVTVPEGAQVSILRVSNNAVTNDLAIAPPTPPTVPMSAQLRLLSQQLGKEVNHYTMPVSVLVTQTVTTVRKLKFLRVIEVTANSTNTSMETNYLPMLLTNVVSCVTNTSPTTP